MLRLLNPKAQEEDRENSLRPRQLEEYIGQRSVVANLRVFLQAAKERNEPLDHVLISGPPGLGKTTLASLVAAEMGVKLRTTSGPAIERPIDLLVLLNTLQQGDVLFIDEIHRLSRVVEEIMYPVTEDLSFDRILSKGHNKGARTHRIPPFTLIGATTRAGSISAPLRSRFGILLQLEFYQEPDLMEIVGRSAGILGYSIEPEGCRQIAARCRGTPRIANRLLRRVRDFAQVEGADPIDALVASRALDRMEIDRRGLDRLDQRILEVLVERFQGHPVGLNTLAAAVQEDPANLEEVYEPYLLAAGFVQKTHRGRQATRIAFEHMGVLPV